MDKLLVFVIFSCLIAISTAGLTPQLSAKADTIVRQSEDRLLRKLEEIAKEKSLPDLLLCTSRCRYLLSESAPIDEISSCTKGCTEMSDEHKDHD